MVIVHSDRLVSFKWLFGGSRILVVIVGLFLLTGYELVFHSLMVSSVEKGPLTQGQPGFKFSVRQRLATHKLTE